MASTDDLSLLAPNLARGVHASAGETFRLREYLRGRAPGTRLQEPPQPGRAFLELNGKLRSGRQPQQCHFTFNWRPVVLGSRQQHSAAPLAAGSNDGVEQLKDELLAGLLRRSGEQLSARLRTGRLPANRQFGIRLRQVVLPPPPQPEPQPEPASPSLAVELEDAGQLAQVAEPHTVARPATLDRLLEQQQGCKTPGTALGRTPMEGVPERLSPAVAGRRLTSTPGTVLGKTPMEGVPERLTSGRHIPARARRPFNPLTALGRTPVEGVPERASPHDRLLLLSVRPRCSQEQAQQSVGSPTWGVVQQAAERSGSGVRPAPAEFTFNASPLSQQGTRGAGEARGLTAEEVPAGEVPGQAGGAVAAAVEQPAAAGDNAAAASNDELDDDGFDYGGNDEPSVIMPAAEGATPLPFRAVDAAVQTGASLHCHATPASGLAAREAAVAHMAAQTGASLRQQPDAEGASDGGLGGGEFDGGYDDDYDAGGLDYDNSEDEEAAAGEGDVLVQAEEQNLAEAAQDASDTSEQRRMQQRRRRTTNHGARLRNELGKRKSLGATPRAGRQEVAPGVRRSTRQHTQPLQWWLGEEKVYNRQQYKTMPTVKEVVHKTPNTPWRMVQDIYRRPKARQRRQQQQREEEMDTDA